jgi:putative membrane protein insertion efficiency factor
VPKSDEPEDSVQQEVEKYVLEKEMVRPSTSVFSAFKWYFVFLTSVFGTTVLLYLFLRFGFPKVADSIQAYVSEHPKKTCAILFVVCHILGLFFAAKVLVIGLVRLYQHYAPEEVRRRCLFKPTCSEYTILAIEKYGLLKGMHKSFDRFDRCHGTEYRIDYP